ncbi:MAG: ATP phosphoribosyltransferase regulatory subunit [Hyphomicrobiaceae bacterium]
MSAESARKFEALEEQAQILLSTFTGAGYEAVAPAILQPAEIFLDVVGEDLRGRTYVFTDPEGAELCLRPDLTVPTCRLHWERHGRADAAGRYCYNGPAFRFQPDGGDPAHPREFRQAGIEFFGAKNHAQAEAEVLQLVLTSLAAAGLEDCSVKIGDLGIFEALLGVLEMPTRWRERLRTQFWRPAAFRAELEEIASRPAAATDGLPEELLRTVAEAKKGAVEAALIAYLETNNIEVIGARSTAEIAENLKTVVDDAAADPLADSTRELLETYLGVKAPAKAAGARMKDLIGASGVDLSGPLDVYERRLRQFASAGIDLSKLTFSAEFGRSLEYYTGFVFEVHAPALDANSPVAGGGRYDKLMRVVGATVDVPAVGAMIHTERLMTAVQGIGA